MKKKIGFMILILSALALNAFAAERLSMELSLPAAENTKQENIFHAVVTGKDQLILKPGPVFTEGDDAHEISLPYLISAVKPISYPRWAVHQGWEGDFIIAIEILKEGNVGRFYVMKSTGHEVLDKAATEAVRTWKFQPALKKGKAVVTCIQIPVRFQIRENS